MTIRLNDEPRTVAPTTTLHALLQELGLGERKGVAVAVNDAMVPRLTWADRALVEADRVLVIHATQGG
jgi:sulfur carrier protein